MGAIIAVAGAYLVAGYQFNEQRRSAASLIYGIFSEPVFRLTNLMEIYGHPSSAVRPPEGYEPVELTKQQWQLVIDAANDFLKSHAFALQQSHRVDSALNVLRPTELFSAFSLEVELKAANELIAKLLESAIQSHRHFPSCPADWDFRVSVEQSHYKARGLLDQIVRFLM